MTPQLVLWLHLLCMVGAFGGLLALRLAVPEGVRRDPAVGRKASRLFNLLLVVGLAAGAGYYALLSGHLRGAHYNGVIGLKFVLMLAAAALLGLSARSARGDGLRTGAMLLLAAAALAGATL
jgi:hypothetical protein